MRVRDHIALSTASAVLARPWLQSGALGLWAGGVLVDADHYAWFCIRERAWSPAAAIQFFNEPQPPRHAGTRMLHHPLALVSLLLLGVRRRALLPVAAGMALHVALDLQHEARMDRARAAALERDTFTCQVCGARTPDVGTHLQHQPLVLPSYSPRNLVALCDACHERAHLRIGWDASWN